MGGGGCKNCPLFEEGGGGREKLYLVLKGGGGVQTSFRVYGDICRENYGEITHEV